MKINEIKSPEQLKDLDIQELNDLCQQIRTFLIENISHTGGHLASNLGIVETCVAMHKVFDSPKDKMIFDVGHQSYVHKILTGRANRFSTLRQFQGLSGFQKRIESVHDCYEAGHSSTALSSALGFAMARDYNHQDYNVIAIVGDASLMSGISLEALNTIGEFQTNMIIILNDNGMSISKNVGALSQTLTKMRTSYVYNTTKKIVRSSLQKNKAGENLYHSISNVKNSLKKNMVESSFFGDFGIDYLGPIDGHNIHQLIQTFEVAKKHQGPIVIHVCTTKGKGYSFAENDTTGKWHGISPFNVRTGEVLNKVPENFTSWSQWISDSLCKLASVNNDIIAITPAMIAGSKLENFKQKYPKRLIDCGIAEDHAAVLASGLAAAGKRPFLAVYSSFMQRCYDPINHDICRMDLPVVIGLDRAGLVGEDGDTHHGCFDIQLLRSLPNIILSQPKDSYEAQNLLYTAFNQNHPFVIRYPRGNVEKVECDFEFIEIGKWSEYKTNETIRLYVISYGNDVDAIYSKALANQLSISVINARFFKPLDFDMLDKIAQSGLPVIVFETDMLAGGLSSAILEYYNDSKQNVNIIRFGIGDHYVSHGSISELRKNEGIDLNSLFSMIGALHEA
ncbi:MAG: 1-deoxy-D-xylulose-5-phosphate synthase [Traorella sp.]